jgi:hypothetical protein
VSLAQGPTANPFQPEKAVREARTPGQFDDDSDALPNGGLGLVQPSTDQNAYGFRAFFAEVDVAAALPA